MTVQDTRLSRKPAAELSTEALIERVMERSNRIEYLGSSHSNAARALAKDALELAVRVAVGRGRMTTW